MEVAVFSDMSVNITRLHITSQKAVALVIAVDTLNFAGEIMCTEFNNLFHIDAFNNCDSYVKA
jgi:hypothetical protein